jgi:hypothetical protein
MEIINIGGVPGDPEFQLYYQQGFTFKFSDRVHKVSYRIPIVDEQIEFVKVDDGHYIFQTPRFSLYLRWFPEENGEPAMGRLQINMRDEDNIDRNIVSADNLSEEVFQRIRQFAEEKIAQNAQNAQNAQGQNEQNGGRRRGTTRRNKHRRSHRRNHYRNRRSTYRRKH